MQEKEYKKHVTIGILCDIASLFILGIIFSGIAYSEFDKNYKNSLDDVQKRKNSIIGKVISSFCFFMSVVYHSLDHSEPLEERMLVCIIVASICAIIVFLVLNNKDKKVIVSDKEKSLKFQCSNCGELVSEDAIKCPNCGEKFEEEENVNKNRKKEDSKKETGNKEYYADINKKDIALRKLKKLLDDNIITNEEFELEKSKILKK